MGTKPAVLVVDDQAGVRRLIYEVLRREEAYRIYLAGSGEEAVALAREVRPDVVLLDVKMPGLDGLTVLRLLKESVPEAKVIVMTAYGELGIRGRADEMGIAHFLTKPFDIYELARVVRETAGEPGEKRGCGEAVT